MGPSSEPLGHGARRVIPAAARSEPPQGAPWDEPIDAAPLAFVDLEMTGLDASRDRVVQLCIERVVGEQTLDRLVSFVDPEGRTGNVEIHGIGPAELAGAPVFGALAPRVLALLEGAVFVAHAATHDVAFLRAEFARVGLAWDAPHVVDTLPLSRRAFNFRSHRLTTLAGELGIACPAAHRADNDVAVLRQVFRRLASELRPRTLRDLWHVRVGASHARPEIVAALADALARKVPVRLRYRPAGRSAQELPFHVTALRTDLDPPMVIGYLSHTRGRRELRIDRILGVALLEPNSPRP